MVRYCKILNFYILANLLRFENLFHLYWAPLGLSGKTSDRSKKFPPPNFQYQQQDLNITCPTDKMTELSKIKNQKNTE